MDKKTTITVGRSVQVFQIGQPEYWNKISISKDFPEDVNVQLAIDDLMAEVEIAHKKHSTPPTADTYFNVSKPNGKGKMKPDLDIRKQYSLAVARQDIKMVENMESIYDFKIG